MLHIGVRGHASWVIDHPCMLCKGEEAYTLLLAHKHVVYIDHAIDITLHVLGGILQVHRMVGGRIYRSWYPTLETAQAGFRGWVKYLEASPHWVKTLRYYKDQKEPSGTTWPSPYDPRRRNWVFDSPNP